MQRTTIYLPDDLKRELSVRARVEGRRESDLIREALSALLRGRERGARSLSFGLFDSGRADTSSTVDAVLASTDFGVAAS
jgi:plasmid stability protein